MRSRCDLPDSVLAPPQQPFRDPGRSPVAGREVSLTSSFGETGHVTDEEGCHRARRVDHGGVGLVRYLHHCVDVDREPLDLQVMQKFLDPQIKGFAGRSCQRVVVSRLFCGQ